MKKLTENILKKKKRDIFTTDPRVSFNTSHSLANNGNTAVSTDVNERLEEAAILD